MATVELTKDNFNEITAGPGMVLVDFWAEWCGPCKMFSPIFESASEAHPEAVFGKVDTEAQAEIAASFEIRSIPTLMIVRDGVIVHSRPGAMGAAVLEELISSVSALDMDAVRAAAGV